MIGDETGKEELPISTILQESIRYFWVKALETLSEERNIKREDVYWVLTVPAIWNDSEKQIMEEAAKMVNIFKICAVKKHPLICLTVLPLGRVQLIFSNLIKFNKLFLHCPE